MTVDFIPKVIMTKFAKFCHACEKWFKRKIVIGILCPCCHNKLRDIPRHIERTTAKYLSQRKYHLKNKEKRNECSRKWYEKNKEKHKENMRFYYRVQN